MIAQLTKKNSLGPLGEEQIAQLLGRFEAEHAVQHYQVFGLPVWPALRVLLGNRLYYRTNHPHSVANSETSASAGARRLGDRLEFFLKPVVDYALWRWRVARGAEIDPSGAADVVVIGGGPRYQPLGQELIHYPTALLVERLAARGLSCCVWHGEAPPENAACKSANVLPAMLLAQRLAAIKQRYTRADIPSWFAEVSDFHAQLLGEPLGWEGVRALGVIPEISRVFEVWLKSARPKLVVIDNWYNGRMMAATAAAKRMGIPIIDLQHGIQEQGHYAYHYWTRIPISQWSTTPDMFWVWGPRAERLIKDTNREPPEVIQGGNMWLNFWVEGLDSRIQAALSKISAEVSSESFKILITLPAAADTCWQFVMELIIQSPSSWSFLLRLHPLDTADPKLVNARLPITAAKVSVHAAADWPLYGLLNMIDLHVSPDSTCALEALAFGKPTVLISKSGFACFKHYLEAGVMFYAPTPEAFTSVVREALATEPAKLREAAQEIFVSDPVHSNRGIARLADIVSEKRV